jgi:capsular exopolysaccharide synthesis family protein
MDLRTFLRAVRKNWWIVIFTTLVGAGAAVGFIAITPPAYASSVTFFVNTAASTEANPLQSAQYAQQRVTTYVGLLSSERLAKLVIADTGLDISVPQVIGTIGAKSDLNTVLLTATVTDTSRARSLRIAESISTQFVKMVGTIDPTVRLEVTSGPTLSPYAVAPRKKLDLGVGTLGGLILGLLAASLREILDTTVRSVDALRRVGNCPVLGHIGRDPGARKSPLIAANNAQSVRSEAFRQLRTNLQFIDVARPANVLVVTSAIATEGKTTTAINLGIAFAEAGRRVLLVDGDLRRPRIAEYLGIETAAGLTNVLAGHVDVTDVLQPWGGGGLTVLASGTVPPNPSELLGSQTMIELMARLRKRFDVILIDTPPLLPVTDGAVAAAHADGAVLVVRFGRAKRHQIASALNSLRSVDARILGTVFNMAPVKTTDAYFAYDGYAWGVETRAVDHLDGTRVGRAGFVPAATPGQTGGQHDATEPAVPAALGPHHAATSAGGPVA